RRAARLARLLERHELHVCEASPARRGTRFSSQTAPSAPQRNANGVSGWHFSVGALPPSTARGGEDCGTRAPPSVWCEVFLRDQARVPPEAYRACGETVAPPGPRLAATARVSRARAPVGGRVGLCRCQAVWTMKSEFPSGSRKKNIGGTGSPMRITPSST